MTRDELEAATRDALVRAVAACWNGVDTAAINQAAGAILAAADAYATGQKAA
jgi:hypothetical protein